MAYKKNNAWSYSCKADNCSLQCEVQHDDALVANESRFVHAADVAPAAGAVANAVRVLNPLNYGAGSVDEHPAAAAPAVGVEAAGAGVGDAAGAGTGI